MKTHTEKHCACRQYLICSSNSFSDVFFQKHVCSQVQNTNATVFPKCKCSKLLENNTIVKPDATAVFSTRVFQTASPKCS